MNIELIKDKINKDNNQLFYEKGQKELLLNKKNIYSKEIKKLEENRDILDQVKLLLRESSKTIKEKIKIKLEKLVTDGLQYIFDDYMRFEIELNETETRTEVNFYVISLYEGEEIKVSPESARGGGVVDIISLILRISILQACNPEMEGPIIFDEPVKMVSQDNIERVSDFLQQLHQYFDRQIILSTHDSYLAEIANNKILISQKNGISKVEKG